MTRETYFRNRNDLVPVSLLSGFCLEEGKLTPTGMEMMSRGLGWI